MRVTRPRKRRAAGKEADARQIYDAQNCEADCRKTRNSIPDIRQEEVVKLDLLGHIAGRREEADQQFPKMVGANAIEVVLAFTT